MLIHFIDFILWLDISIVYIFSLFYDGRGCIVDRCCDHVCVSIVVTRQSLETYSLWFAHLMLRYVCTNFILLGLAMLSCFSSEKFGLKIFGSTIGKLCKYWPNSLSIPKVFPLIGKNRFVLIIICLQSNFMHCNNSSTKSTKWGIAVWKYIP